VKDRTHQQSSNDAHIRVFNVPARLFDCKFEAAMKQMILIGLSGGLSKVVANCMFANELHLIEDSIQYCLLKLPSPLHTIMQQMQVSCITHTANACWW
jgi:hypothetical protein